jgi:hypothetical protein
VFARCGRCQLAELLIRARVRASLFAGGLTGRLARSPGTNSRVVRCRLTQTYFSRCQVINLLAPDSDSECGHCRPQARRRGAPRVLMNEQVGRRQAGQGCRRVGQRRVRGASTGRARGSFCRRARRGGVAQRNSVALSPNAPARRNVGAFRLPTTLGGLSGPQGCYPASIRPAFGYE